MSAFRFALALALAIPSGAIAQAVPPGPVAPGGAFFGGGFFGGGGGFGGGFGSGGFVGVPAFHPGPPGFRFRPLQPGFFIDPFWFGPQFHIQSWQHFGFSRPPRGHRWVRFFNDACLIGRRGRVRFCHHGFFAAGFAGGGAFGGGAWHPGMNQGWVMPQQGLDHSFHGAQGAMPAQGWGGWGVAYPIVIETVIIGGGSSSAATVVEEVIEEYEEVETAPVVRTIIQPRRIYVRPPPPPPGERG
ncbi:MAG: RcnB family protein [Sphingosinicella sp.]